MLVCGWSLACRDPVTLRFLTSDLKLRQHPRAVGSGMARLCWSGLICGWWVLTVLPITRHVYQWTVHIALFFLMLTHAEFLIFRCQWIVNLRKNDVCVFNELTPIQVILFTSVRHWGMESQQWKSNPWKLAVGQIYPNALCSSNSTSGRWKVIPQKWQVINPRKAIMAYIVSAKSASNLGTAVSLLTNITY